MSFYFPDTSLLAQLLLFSGIFVTFNFESCFPFHWPVSSPATRPFFRPALFSFVSAGRTHFRLQNLMISLTSGNQDQSLTWVQISEEDYSNTLLIFWAYYCILGHDESRKSLLKIFIFYKTFIARDSVNYCGKKSSDFKLNWTAKTWKVCFSRHTGHKKSLFVQREALKWECITGNCKKIYWCLTRIFGKQSGRFCKGWDQGIRFYDIQQNMYYALPVPFLT